MEKTGMRKRLEFSEIKTLGSCGERKRIFLGDPRLEPVTMAWHAFVLPLDHQNTFYLVISQKNGPKIVLKKSAD